MKGVVRRLLLGTLAPHWRTNTVVPQTHAYFEIPRKHRLMRRGGEM